MMMRVGELAELIGVPDYTLRRLAKLGVLPCKRLATKRAHWRFAKSDVPKIMRALVDAGVLEEPVRKK